MQISTIREKESDHPYAHTPRAATDRRVYIRSGKRTLSSYYFAALGLLRIRWMRVLVFSHICISECCSLIPRILFRCDTKLDSLGVGHGLDSRKYPILLPASYTATRTRTLGIQRMLANYPWATLVDAHIFLAGWGTAIVSEQMEHKKDSCISQKVC
jgi:hypothetical protein